MKGVRIGILVLFFAGCQRPQGDDQFFPPRNCGKIGEVLKEASGLVASVNNPGMLWSLNDSGNDAEVFLINTRARVELTCTVDGVENRDWEDIAIGIGPQKNVPYLYVGDIGDNNMKYDLKFVYRFPEPHLDKEKKMRITQFDTLIFRLPDQRRDAETLLIDPLTNDLFIISKREDSVVLYRSKYPYGKGTITMENMGKLPYKLIVAASISEDGQEVLLKNYGKVYYWKREANEDLVHLFSRAPKRLSYEPEHQGEAIAWARDTAGFYTLSESSVADRAQLKFFKRK